MHDRIVFLASYVAAVIEGCVIMPNTNGPSNPRIWVSGSAKKDYDILRSLGSLVASLPASEHPQFREEFNTVRTDFVFSVNDPIERISVGICGRTANNFPRYTDQVNLAT